MTFATKQRFTKVVIVLGFTITLALAVYPDLLLAYVGIHSKDWSDPTNRFFTGLNAIFLTLFTVVGSRRLLSDASEVIVSRIPSGPMRPSADPYRSLIVYDQFPSFQNQSDVLRHVSSAVILANYKCVRVSSLSDLDKELHTRSAVGIVADKSFEEDVLHRTMTTGTSLYTLAQANSFSNSRLGNRVELRIGSDMNILSNVYKTAAPLAHAHIPDVVRSVGFHGTWATTYGILALDETRDGSARGVYWYGRGEIQGDIEIDEAGGTINLKFRWSQANNSGDTGSRSNGSGVFVLPAGFEFFYGHWYIAGSTTRQLWCGSRLSRDIIVDMTKGGEFSRNFGLSQHPLSHLVDPGAV